jgi:NhaP-type Na+/H+ or K+/H+ antiporter
LFSVVVLGFAAVSRGLGRVMLTAPITFVVAGAMASLVLGAPSLETTLQIRNVAELALALVLFHDAARVRPRQLAGDVGLLLRVLLLAVPLTVGVGFVLARWVFPDAPVMTALLLATALAPTDAGLGSAMMTNQAVPVRIRRLLNLESGFNDGLVTPVVLFAIVSLEGVQQLYVGMTVGMALLELGGGILVGVAVGAGGGLLLGWSRKMDLSSPSTRALGVLGVPILAYFLAAALGAEPFISVFVAGLGFAGSAAWADEESSSLGLTEALSEPLGMAVWLVFGLAATPFMLSRIGWPELAFALLSLVVVRPLALGLSLLGTRLRWQSVAFVGWFGPRGLVTIIFVLLALESLEPAEIGRQVIATATLTVLLSVVAHGLTAEPLAARYGAWVSRVQPERELMNAAEPQVRAPWRRRPIGGAKP